MINFFVLYTILIYIINLIFYLRAWFMFKEDEDFEHDNPSISILVPVYNEGLTIIDSLISMTKQTYENYNIIVINDGSTDDTVEKIINHFGLTKIDINPYKFIDNHKQVRGVYATMGMILLDKPNGGKSDALNAGFAYSNAEYILSVDGDTLIEKRALKTLITKKKPNYDAVASMVGISNDNKIVEGEIEKPKLPTTFWGKVQWVEYYRCYVLLKNSFRDYNSTTVISGACCFISAEMILKTGGYKHDHLGEDMEHTLNIYRQGGKIQFLNEILSWTEAPNNIKDLGKQRIRWFRGAFQSYVEYRDLMFCRKNKALGWIMLPYVWFSDILGCWLEFFGVLYSIFLLTTSDRDLVSLAIIWVLVLMLHFSNFLISFLFIKYKLKLFEKYKGVILLTLIEGFTYHYCYIFWILKAHILEIFKVKITWNKLERVGFETVEVAK